MDRFRKDHSYCQRRQKIRLGFRAYGTIAYPHSAHCAWTTYSCVHATPLSLITLGGSFCPTQAVYRAALAFIGSAGQVVLVGTRLRPMLRVKLRPGSRPCAVSGSGSTRT
ncbi:UNVERIFIED_CONTAM: hypothetical protein Sangu_0166100 [Sesamum angustifolium]|uniref:Uncharacterized protein n=1 Tax=Sesamum angustifolium TaxID=2727405 RepID=A0AAW2RNM2_9LAMI